MTNWKWRARLRRLLLTALVVAQVAFATRYMLYVLPYHGDDGLELSITLIFILLFTWISIGFWLALYGFLLRRLGGDPLSLLKRHQSKLAQMPLAPTAIIMPIYNEPIERTLGGLRAVYCSLQASGHIDAFDFYILSDSRDPDIWLAEQAAWYKLCEELGAAGKLFYRRRPLNMHYKSGNVADFFRRWGRNYEYTIVLDADSLMEGETLVTMVRLMECEPNVGILQTSPRLLNGASLFARVQQFGNQFYGPLFSTGLAALQLGEAAYWGHNAIIRSRLFMQHCGLSGLKGPGIFGGSILSHDFVEAAYMGRAGYEVWLEPDLEGTYEESPPTLVDELTRDRRWAKGNLQHLWLMFTPGLRLAHRMAFLNGIMSYCASPLWLTFLILSTFEVTRLILWPIDYFPKEYALYPVWPEFHPEMAVILATSTVSLLFVPKFLALLDAVLSHRIHRFGGSVRLLAGLLLEILVSILLAPIRMLAHTRYVIEALFNINLRWAGQNRTEETGWKDAFRNQLPGTLIALGWSGFALWLDEMFFFWSLPVALPLMLASGITVLTGRKSVGEALARKGILNIPEDVKGSPVLEELNQMPITDAPHTYSAFIQAVVDPVVNRVQCALARGHRGGSKHKRLRVLRRRCLLDGPASLSPKEITLLAKDQESLQWLHQEIWCSPPDSYWADYIRQWRRESHMLVAEPATEVNQPVN